MKVTWSGEPLTVTENVVVYQLGADCQKLPAEFTEFALTPGPDGSETRLCPSTVA